MTFVSDKPRFVPATVEATAGTITFFLRNVRFQTAVHNFHLGPELLVGQAASPQVQAGPVDSAQRRGCARRDNTPSGATSALVVSPTARWGWLDP